jgi:acyl-CoA thioesterase-2
MPIISFEDTLACLDLEGIGEGRYTAPNIPMPYYRIFGGQLLAQLVAIASETAPGKQVKSLHVLFPREGDLREPVEFAVSRPQDGRTFAGRQIAGTQGGKTIVTATVSLHALEEGPEHQLEGPQVGAPEDASAVDLSMIPWETRVVGGVDLESRGAGPAELSLWMRAPALPEEPAVHQALFAHATDLTLIGTSLRPFEGLGEADSPERIHTAVTSHTIWFHRELQLDDWILLSQQSPVVARARGFGQGHAFARNGALVASYAQESMIRPVG